MKIPAMTLTDPSSGSPVDSDDDEEGADEDSISVELFSFSNIIFFHACLCGYVDGCIQFVFATLYRKICFTVLRIIK